ncbi:sensor domain-containing diguanylate cyclase [Robertmurraya kyonggiensis]|nr:sensor domain-containing diguanylate cyclase [Robertmurraya kyonggiensis]
MGVMYFTFGLFVGIIICQVRIKFVKKKWKSSFNEIETILQLLEESTDVIYHFDIKPEMGHRYISPALDKFLGEGVIKEAFENPFVPFELIHPEDFDHLTQKLNGTLDYSKPIIQRWKDKEGNYRWFEEYTTPIYENGELVAIQGIMRNMDEKIKLRQDLEYQINHDALTDIYNRGYFETIFSDLDGHIDTTVGIVLCDLDELKVMNDHFGHKSGDALLKETAKVLNQFSAEDTMVARIGGDEFALLAVEKTEREIEQLVQDISIGIHRHNENPLNMKIKLSIGYAFTSNSIGKMTELFSQADKNMYKDKTSRKQLLV